MIPINRPQIDALTKIVNSKSIPGKDNPDIYAPYAYSLLNHSDLTRDFSVYEMGHWINYNDRWIHNKNSNNTTGYRRGSILFIDLGATNYRYEPSFTHPCVVLAENRDFIFIVPCSSKKYGYGFPEIIDATPADGFSCNTGIQTKSFRWISKNRVISKLGQVSAPILDKIDNAILQLIPTYNKTIMQKDNEISQLQSDLSIANNSLSTLEAEHDACKQELELLKISLQQADVRIKELEIGNN